MCHKLKELINLITNLIYIIEKRIRIDNVYLTLGKNLPKVVRRLVTVSSLLSLNT